MRKIRIYLDTSVISMIDTPYDPEIETITRDFFQILLERNDEFQAYFSEVGITEIEKSSPKKQSLFKKLLHDLNYVYIPKSSDVEDIIGKYLQAGFLTKRHIDDITHLAYAVFVQCDYIASWNMEHIVRERTSNGVRVVNESNNYHTPSIVTPILFIQENTRGNHH